MTSSLHGAPGHTVSWAHYKVGPSCPSGSEMEPFWKWGGGGVRRVKCNAVTVGELEDTVLLESKIHTEAVYSSIHPLGKPCGGCFCKAAIPHRGLQIPKPLIVQTALLISGPPCQHGTCLLATASNATEALHVTGPLHEAHGFHPEWS